MNETGRNHSYLFKEHRKNMQNQSGNPLSDKAIKLSLLHSCAIYREQEIFFYSAELIIALKKMN